MRAMQMMATLFFYLSLFGCGGDDGGSDSTSAPGNLQLSASFYEVAEDAGELTVTVNRTDGTTGVVAVDYATSDGTGIAGVDYAAISDTLNFGDGVTSRSFVVGVIDDSDLEGEETFTVALSNPIGGAILRDPTSAIVSIINNDTPIQGSLQFSADAYAIAEDTGSVTVTVNRIGGFSGEVTVDYASSDGSATSGEDYVSSTGTLTFGDGVLSQSFTVSIIDDSLVEDDETFLVSLSNATGGAVVTSPATAVVTIIDNDIPPLAGSLRLSAPAYSVSENDSALDVIVERTGGSEGEVTVDYATSDGTASAGQDYVATSGMLIFGNGVLSQIFTVSILDDIDVEQPETFNVVLSTPGGGATLASPTSAVATISDNDSAIAQVYDFEHLRVFNAISQQDNWVLSLGDAVIVKDTTAINGTQVLSPATVVIFNMEARASRVNDASFSFTPINGTQAEIQFEATGEAVSLFALGRDLNGDGALRETDREIGPAFGIFDRKFAIKEANLGTLSSVELGSGNSGSDWYRLRLHIDFLANGGEGAGSLAFMNLSDGDTTFTDVVGLQNINIKLSRMDDNAGPTSWNTMYLQLLTDGGNVPGVDNLEPNIGP